MMNRQFERGAPSRGVVLVASDSRLFADIVGEMLVESGFTATPVVTSELTWTSVKRLRPCLVICDCEAPAENVERIFAEVSAGRIPVLLSQTGPKPNIGRALRLAQRVAWFTFPISRTAFAATLETVLLTPPSTSSVAAGVAGATLDADVSVRDRPVAARREIS